MNLSTQTQLLCSLADPGADLTGALYNEMIQALGVDAIYLPTCCPDVAAGFAGTQALGLTGFSVSMPHKQAIMPLLDRIDTTAREIGAVNTVVCADGQWCGYNTDWYGAVEALKEKTAIAGKKVLLLGAGGAAKAIAYGIKAEGGELFIANRTHAKAETLAEQFDATLLHWNALAAAPSFDIIVNATAIGFMARQDAGHPLPPALLRPGQVVFDIVFSPIETALLKDAAGRGAVTVPGYKMFIHQAILQFKLWLGAELKDTTPIERAMREYLRRGAF